MKRGAGLGGSGTTAAALAAGATGFASGGAGFAGTADGGATVCRGGAPGTEGLESTDGRAGAELWTVRCSTALRTSPGFEICDKSILGLNSSTGAVARELRAAPGSACSAKYFFTRSASSTSIELECVFFSVTPTLTRASRIALLFTSSSRARSLIRIFCMPPCFLRVVRPVRPSWHPHGKCLPSAATAADLLPISAPPAVLRRECSRSPSPAARASSPRRHRHREHFRRHRRLQLRSIGPIRPGLPRCRK